VATRPADGLCGLVFLDFSSLIPFKTSFIDENHFSFLFFSFLLLLFVFIFIIVLLIFFLIFIPRICTFVCPVFVHFAFSGDAFFSRYLYSSMEFLQSQLLVGNIILIWVRASNLYHCDNLIRELCIHVISECVACRGNNQVKVSEVDLVIPNISGIVQWSEFSTFLCNLMPIFKMCISC
jgi:hypothetical protein